MLSGNTHTWSAWAPGVSTAKAPGVSTAKALGAAGVRARAAVPGWEVAVPQAPTPGAGASRLVAPGAGGSLGGWECVAGAGAWGAWA